MKIIRIDRNNQVNGTGLRDVIWCAGCSHNCPGCQNKEAQNPDLGKELSQEHFDILKEDLYKEEIEGVTFSGGEATFPSNIDEATKMMAWIKNLFPNKTIWLYTGFLYEEIESLEMMKYIDVLVDGRYVESENPGPGHLKWRGSKNQRVIDLKETRRQGKVVWLKDFNGKFIYENETNQD